MNLKRGVLLLLVALLLPVSLKRNQVTTIAPVNAKEQCRVPYSTPNQSPQVGDHVYGRIIEAPDKLWLQPSETGNSIENTLLYQEYSYVSERHKYLDPGQIIRVIIVNEVWGQIQPEYDQVKFDTYDTLERVYIKLQFIEVLGNEFSQPLSLFEDTAHYDKLIVVVDNGGSPVLVAYEGNQLVLKVPVVLGETPYGDKRIWRVRISDDMPGIPGVPFAQCFAGGYCVHGAPWWNWRYTESGHYGSHGCVNLPDGSWYTVPVDGIEYSVDEWLFRWTQSGLSLDASNASIEESSISSADFGWYQPLISTRFLVLNGIEELRDFPYTHQLGTAVQHAVVRDWQPLIDAFNDSDEEWVLPIISQSSVTWSRPSTAISVAEVEGEELDDTWVLLECQDETGWNQPAAPGASRTKGEICNHFITERPGSICTPERVDLDYFGQRVYCVAETFNLSHMVTRGELIQHETKHLEQFSSPYLRQLWLQGIAVDDVSIGYVGYEESLGAWLEFGAQAENADTSLDDFYRFVLLRPTASGWRVEETKATTERTMEFLHEICGDATGENQTIRHMILEAAAMDENGYHQFTTTCGIAPHRVVVDYVRQ